MASATVKIVVLGSINGQYNVFEKLAKLHSKNNFSFAIIVGDLFSEPSEDNETTADALILGRVKVPLPTYFSLGQHPLPPKVIKKLDSSEGELCENLFFLGKRSTSNLSEGVRIVTIGGCLDPHVAAGTSKDRYLPYHTEGDVKALYGAHKTDLLLSFRWPSNVQTNSQIKLESDFDDTTAEACIADLCATLKPRYHFSTAERLFYEREPFFHPDSEGKPDTSLITRFISLAAFGNPEGKKWLYAFSIDPNHAPLTALPPATTASPFSWSHRKRQRLPDQAGSYSRFSADTNQSAGRHRPSKRKRPFAPPPGPQDCFFCLSNPDVATHLITSIGNDSYITTAKGPLTASTTFPDLGFPAHMLIIPLSHSPTLASVSPEETKLSTYQEMTHYRGALQKMLARTAKGKLGALTWEVNRTEGIHTHWQFLPVSADLIRRGLLLGAFQVEAENQKYPKIEACTDKNELDQAGDFFRFWIWEPNAGLDSGKSSGNQEEVERSKSGEAMRMSLTPDMRFDLQFGRKVMAKLMGLEARIQWRDCLQDEADETRDAENFKKAFKDFDFSTEES